MERASENQYSKWKSAVQLDQEDGGDDADLALGEVEHPVGPVDQDQADRQQPVAEPDDDPLQEDVVRCEKASIADGP